MAGNVTAFNTVLTYDLYQAYFRPGRTDRHYFLTGKSSLSSASFEDRRGILRLDV